VQQLVRVREVMVAHAASDEKKVALLVDLAELLEKRLDKPEAAFDAAARALRVDPARRDTYDRLDRLAERTSAWPALLELYREVARRPLGLHEQVDLRCRLGRLYRDRLADPEKAIATYTRVLDLDNNNAEAAKALSALRGSG
jgi:tetratricopeptide (TPR) repeat protein